MGSLKADSAITVCETFGRMFIRAEERDQDGGVGRCQHRAHQQRRVRRQPENQGGGQPVIAAVTTTPGSTSSPRLT